MHTLKRHPNNPPISGGVQASGLNIVSSAGTLSGDSNFVITPALGANNKYLYVISSQAVIPNVDAIATTGFTAWDGKADITIANGERIVFLEVDATNKVKKAGEATAITKP